MPEPGPLGETFFDANDRAMVAASFVNKAFAGCVESVVTFGTQRSDGRLFDFFLDRGIQQEPSIVSQLDIAKM